MNKAHEAETPATGHAEREAFEKWASMWPVWDKHDQIAFHEGWQAGRAALLAEIKAGGAVMEVIDYNGYLLNMFPKDAALRLGDKLYRLPEGE